jgi:DNA polymerase-3 subunit gamma/tau
MSQALYRKWRPAQWDQVIGQEHVVQTLRNAIASERVAHSYLFAGPRGTGKTTTARLLAKAVNCLSDDLALRPCNQCAHCQAVNQGRFLDLIEIDAASNTSVEDVRDLRDKINFSPNQGRYKVYIIDEVHMLSTAAFNALLKTLEEPPPHAIFILATTEGHKIPATVLSRCQWHEFRRIPVNEIVTTLKSLAKQEKIKVEEPALLLIARQATGALRDAISLLDQLASTGKPVTLELAQAVLGTATSQAVLDLAEALVARDAAAGLDVIHHTLDTGSDPRQFTRQIVDYLRSLLLVAMGNAGQVEVTQEVRSLMARHAHALSTTDLLRLLNIFNQAATEIRSGWQPALPLEMAFIQAITPAPVIVQTPSGVEKAAGRAPDDMEAAKPVGTVKPARAGSARAVETAAEHPSPPAPVARMEESSPEDNPLNQRLHDEWKEILRLLKLRDPSLSGLASSSNVQNIKNNVLRVGFKGEILPGRMNQAENVKVMQEVVKQVLGIELGIQGYALSGNKSAPPPEVDGDGMVAAALRDLGGEIVDIQ